MATQAGVAMLLSAGIPALAGRQDLGLIASAGALSAVFLAGRTPVAGAERLLARRRSAAPAISGNEGSER